MVSVRLDVVVKVKAREEARRLEQLVAARQRVDAARRALRAAEERAGAELTARGRAADFFIYEVARARALELVKQARQALDTASHREASAQSAWAAARSQAEAVRRLADARRAEVRQLAEAREQKSSDDLTLLRFAHTG